jgi:RimJ/RimL family protein N-acetyltransferase
MKNIFLQSKHLIFEPLEEKHISYNYVSWLNDPEITKFNSHGIFPNTLEKTKDYVDSISKNNSQIVLAIIEKESNIHIGNISISSIDYINSNAEISIVLGEKSSWSKGYATESFNTIIDHIFNKLNIYKVTAGTTSDNIGMQKVFKKLNMDKEATLKDHVKRDNQYFDIYRYAKFNTK